ncbi:MarR family transcriptional regulator [bacterium]|nr:MAG: MarR family transcriptional regulator [bacterium]
MANNRTEHHRAQRWQFLRFQDLMRERQFAMTGTEWSLFCFIYDRTWGWSKLWDRISYSQFCKGITDATGHCWHRGTGLSRSSVIRGLKSLQAKGLIETKPAGSGIAFSIKREFAPPGLFVSKFEPDTQ